MIGSTTRTALIVYFVCLFTVFLYRNDRLQDENYDLRTQLLELRIKNHDLIHEVEKLTYSLSQMNVTLTETREMKVYYFNKMYDRGSEINDLKTKLSEIEQAKQRVEKDLEECKTREISLAKH